MRKRQGNVGFACSLGHCAIEVGDVDHVAVGEMKREQHGDEGDQPTEIPAGHHALHLKKEDQ